jgi:hypothetical protein
MNRAVPTLRGRCHCGKVEVAFATQRDPSTLHPRACDCSFCRKHGAAWISDAQGELLVTASANADLREYLQGSGNAHFLLCGECGVLVAVVFPDGNGLLGAMNAGCLDEATPLGDATPVSPQTLTADDRMARWRKLWMTTRIQR